MTCVIGKSDIDISAIHPSFTNKLAYSYALAALE